MLAVMMIAAALAQDAGPRDIVVDRDDVEITSDATVTIGTSPIVDANGNGVIHITGSNITVRFADNQMLRGAQPHTPPDQMTGIGIVITGRNVTLGGLRISGYRVGLHAHEADGLTINSAHFDDNFRQRLRSNPMREDVADWLSPHENDQNQWIDRYGASLWVEDSSDVSISNVRIRNGQNGIVLDCVNDSRIFDCDCSFLSGWGIAMWRSSDNIICRNALDFCIRGYSHGVYNRGQDSAGLLMFEQCNNNIIAENSITHGGDGVFMFAGREALGEANPREDLNWYKGRGCSGNTFHRNDLSYAAAHGLECTFSFDNVIVDNRFVENAICGIWGGYSQRTGIASNEFARNGDQGYGLERGAVNIEHGVENCIIDNSFDSDRCGVHLWWDNDASLFELPWYRANQSDSGRAACIRGNRFRATPVAIHLRDLRRVTEIGRNSMEMNEDNVLAEGDSPHTGKVTPFDDPRLRLFPKTNPGKTEPVGARASLQGRHNIIMTEWGPWDHASPLARRTDDRTNPAEHQWKLHGTDGTLRASQRGGVEVRLHTFMGNPPTITITSPKPGIHPYVVDINAADYATSLTGVLMDVTWNVGVFAWSTDPREDIDAWREESRQGVHHDMPDLRLVYGNGGPDEVLGSDALSDADIGSNQFGTIASSTLPFPAGTWRIRTVSDDGIRVWFGDDAVIDDWTWHPPREHIYEFTLDEPRDIPIRVEHFELDGYAVLTLEIEHVDID